MRQPLRDRSVRGLVATQLLGAFNDNLFKQIMLLLAARLLFPGEDRQGIAFAVFALPFLLFSVFAGRLAERFSKRDVIVAMKVLEVCIMLLAVGALAVRSWALLLVTLFVMGTQSALFGPSKYGVIPELVPRHLILATNGIVSMTTFAAILAGQAVAGPLLDVFPDRWWVGGVVCVGIAALGAWMALGIRATPATRPDEPLRFELAGGLAATVRALRGRGPVLQILLLNSLFWFHGGIVQQTVTGMGRPEILDLAKDQNTWLSALLANAALAIMVTSLLAPRVVERLGVGRTVAAAALAMLAAQASLLLVGPVLPRGGGGYLLAHAAMSVAGVGAGLFVVPLVSWIQDRPPPGLKGRAFALNNFLNFTLIFLAGACYQLGEMAGALPTWTAALSAVVLVAGVGVAWRWLREIELAV